MQSTKRFFRNLLRLPDLYSGERSRPVYHLAESQAFVDGNKRAALDVALTFLAINGFEIEDEQMELYDAMIAIAEKKMTKEQLASLLEKLTTESSLVCGH